MEEEPILRIACTIPGDIDKEIPAEEKRCVHGGRRRSVSD